MARPGRLPLTALLMTSLLVLTAPGGQAGTAALPVADDAVTGADDADSPGLASDLGTLWLQAPEVAPGGAPDSPTPDLDRVRLHLEDGDTLRALRDAERIVEETRWGRERLLASFVAGLIYRERGLHNLASESFTRVRISKHPLSEWAAFYEAEQDRLRGKPWTAVRECERYRETWPEGRFDAACQRLMARALVEAGRTSRARTVADEHDEAFPDDAIREQIDLAIAHRWTDLHPELATPLLRELVIDHHAPLTGRVAESLLADLRAAGHEDAVIPDSTAALQQRAVSLRDAKRKDEAWALFQELVQRAEDDPSLAAWVETAGPTFAWRCHRWDALAAMAAARYAESGDEDDLWTQYKALDRGGRNQEALAIALVGQEEHGRTRRWRRTEEILARTALLAHDYDEARTQLDRVVKRGGWSGRRAAYTAGFAAWMAGDHDDAIARLTKIIDRNRGYVPHARYWRSRAYAAKGDLAAAHADRQWLLTEAPLDWYALLVRLKPIEGPAAEADSVAAGADGAGPGDGTVDPAEAAAAPAAASADPAPSRPRRGPPWDRTGRWVQPELPELPTVSTIERVGEIPVARPRGARPTRVQPPATGLAALAPLTWPLRPAGDPSVPIGLDQVASEVFQDPALPPPSYRPSALWDRDEARRDLDRLARRHGEDWPEWIVARDLADAGLYDVSGPVMSGIYEEWRKAWRNPRHPRHTASRKISPRTADWRTLFYVTRDHHHADRFTYEWWDHIDDPELRRESYRLGWPLAHDHAVWRHAREEGIDPYLVMGLMRIESRYNSIAVSPVGARGAMQIMPRTGRLLADLKGDEDFLSGDLEDPVFAVGYGIFYLGRLMERFDGNAPLAVASYNGGPFNVSSWLEGGGDLPMDEFVEHIPFRETRNYVRKVTAAYAHYLDLYVDDEDVAIVLPEPPYANDPTVVDF